MKNSCHYRLILNTNKEKNAKVILSRIKKASTLFVKPDSFEPYNKEPSQMVVQGNNIIIAHSFENAVFNVLKSLQCFVYGWQISGDYANEISLIADKFRESGILFINLTISSFKAMG